VAVTCIAIKIYCHFYVRERSERISEIAASPASTPIILPTPTPTSGTGVVNLENPLIPQEFQAGYFTWVKKIQKV
jgi:hypothetical protein